MPARLLRRNAKPAWRCRQSTRITIAALAHVFLLATPGRAVLAQQVNGAVACAGDCDTSNSVTVDELVRGVRIALGSLALADCASFDANADGQVTVDELLQAVNAALVGCPPANPTPQTTMPATPTPTPIPVPAVRIISPAHGIFTLAATAAVTGRVTNHVAGAVVTVNGAPVTVEGDGTFATSITLDRQAIFNPVLAELTVPAMGFAARDRVVVIAGDAVLSGDFSAQSLALRINDSGFDQVEPALPALLNLNLETLISPGTTIVSGFCIQRIFGRCVQRVKAVARSASFDSVTVDVDSMSDFVTGNIVLNNLLVRVNIRGGIVDCNADLAASQATIRGNYDLIPLASNPSRVDVNQIDDVTVNLTRFDFNFTSGFCDVPVIGDLISAITGNIEPTVRNGLVDFLRDPDGPGPLDSPIASAIQTSLAGVALGGPFGDAVEVDLDSPLFGIGEDSDGVTFGADARMTAANPDPAAPHFSASYRTDETFPALGPRTPVGQLPYDLGLCVSPTAFNQLLAAEVENGLLADDLTEIDLGSGPTPITASVLSLLIPEFAAFDPDLPMTIRLRSTLAPIVTGDAGPGSELTTLRISQLILEVRSGTAGNETSHIRIATDVQTGLDVAFSDATEQLVFAVTRPRPTDISVAILANGIGTSEAKLRMGLPAILAQVFPRLSGSLGSFPIPKFFGLQTQGVEVSRNGKFMCAFLDLRSATSTAP
ncbi:MAG: hypothetical protein ACE5I7_14450 [Candidatus Binatia bacterium]